MIAQLPFNLLIDAVGWRAAMYLNLGLGVALLGVMYAFIYDHPPGKAQMDKRHPFSYQSFMHGLKRVLLKPQNWFCGVYASLINLPIMVFGALWGLMYLMQVFNLSRLESSTACAALFFGMLIGGPIFGFISDKMRLRKLPMLLGLILCLASNKCQLIFWKPSLR